MLRTNGKSDVSVLNGEVALANPAFPDDFVFVKKGMKTSVSKKSKPNKPRKMSKKELKKLVSKTKIITKKIIIKLTPEFLGQKRILVKKTSDFVEYKYSLKIKNIDSKKTAVILMVLKNGEIFKELPMKMVKGNNKIKSEKLFELSYKFAGAAKYNVRYKIKNK